MEHSSYIQSIKNALKIRGIKYSELANSMKMTESGIKKMLNSKDLSFRRVLQICDVLEISPGQLFSASEEAVISILRFTTQQEDTLLADRLLLKVFWLLTVEQCSADQITRRCNLSPHDTQRKLQKLVTLDLAYQRKNQYLPKHRGKFRWPEDSRLATTLNDEWSHDLLRKALKVQGPKAHRLISIKLTRDSFVDLQNRISALFDEAVRLSEKETLMRSQRLVQDATLMFAILNESVI